MRYKDRSGDVAVFDQRVGYALRDAVERCQNL